MYLHIEKSFIITLYKKTHSNKHIDFTKVFASKLTSHFTPLRAFQMAKQRFSLEQFIDEIHLSSHQLSQ